jgi:phthiodiolone/phenolphthiodiolone dimycocerosates ketoreductase
MTLAQAFVSLDPLSRGRAVLGSGAGERENAEPFGLDFSRPVGCCRWRTPWRSTLV